MTVAVASRLFNVLEIAGTAADRIDRKNRIIRGVKIIGLESSNKARVLGLSEREFGPAVHETYRYSKAALESAVKLYDGAKVYLDHLQFRTNERTGARVIEDRERSISEQFGWITNARMKPDGMYGDLEYLEAHPLSQQVLETIDRRPSQLSLSHNSFVEPKLIDGRIVIIRIGEVKSVDLIGQEPGTTANIFESKATPTKGRTMLISPRKVLESAPRRTDGYHGLRAVIEMGHDDAVLDAAADRDMEFKEGEEQVEPEVDSKSQVKAALGQMVAAVFADDSLDAAATLAKMKDIIAAQEKLMGTGKPPKETSEADHNDDDEAKTKALEAADDEKDEEKKKLAQESKLREAHAKDRSRLEVMESRETARDELEQAGLKPTTSEVCTYAAIESNDHRDDYVDMLKAMESKLKTDDSGHIEPRSQAPRNSNVGDDDNFRVPDGKKLAALIK